MTVWQQSNHQVILDSSNFRYWCGGAACHPDRCLYSLQLVKDRQLTDLLDMPDSQLLVYRDEDGTIMIDIRTHEADVPLDEMLVGGDRA